MVISVPAEYPREVVISYYNHVQSPLIVGIDSYEFNAETENFLNEVKPSGVVLLSNNIRSYEQTKELITQIHRYAKTRGVNINVMVDEEGGIVSRFKNLRGYPAFRGLKEYDKGMAVLQVSFLKDIGIDTNLAPVTDIEFEADSAVSGRCAASLPQKVAEVTTDYISLLHTKGIKSSIKHFPGHGRTNSDTHTSLSTVDISYDQWLTEEALPIISAINEGTEYIMMGHLSYPRISDEPASISSKWVNIIRDDLKFKGEIMTDDLKMGGIVLENIRITCVTQPDKVFNKYSILIKKTLDSGINYPMIILNENDMVDVYREWTAIEEQCN